MNRIKRHFFNGILLCAVDVSSLCAHNCLAQDLTFANASTGFPENTAHTAPANIESIDPISRNVHLTIPLFTKKGRATTSLVLNAEYDSTLWAAADTGKWTPTMANGGWRIGTTSIAGVLHYVGQWCGSVDQGDIWYYMDVEGTRHSFEVRCGSPAATPATDGSGYLLTAGSDTFVSLIDKSGNMIVPPMSNDYVSSGVTSSGNPVVGSATITDTNGNKILANASTIIDTTGQAVVTISALQTTGATQSQTYTYTDNQGVSVSVTIQYGNYTVATNFSAISANYVPSEEFPPTPMLLPNEIDLPDGQIYSFTYEPTPGYPAYTTARVSTVHLPSGGILQYTYGVPPGTTQYPPFIELTHVTPDGTWQYTKSSINSPVGLATESLINPAGDETVYEFQAGAGGPSRISKYSGLATSNSVPLEQTTYCASYSATGALTPVGRCATPQVYGPVLPCPPQPGAQCNSNPLGMPIAMTETTSKDGSFVSQKYTTYTSGREPLSISQYDSSGNLMTATNYTYASLGGNMLDRLSLVVKEHPDGTIKLQDSYPSYDSHGNVLSSIETGTQIASASYIYGYTANGLLQSMVDPNGNETTIEYGDCGNSYPTVYHLPLGQTINAHWDCNGGVPLYTIDANGNKTTYTYDKMWRTASVGHPGGGELDTQYNWATAPMSVSWQTWLDGSGDKMTYSTLLDWDGRQVKKITQPDTSLASYIDLIYDSVGRLQAVSNPYASVSDPTYGITTSQYDALGRAVFLCNPDNGKSSAQVCAPNLSYQQHSYNGTNVIIYDESRSMWSQNYDALGRLISIAEPNGAITTYTYNDNADTFQINQMGLSGDTVRAHYFTYDGKDRLMSSSNPETGTICYGLWSGGSLGSGSCKGGYDSNGNLLYKTDARGVVTTYQYDALNRMVRKTVPVVVNTTGGTSGYVSTCIQYDTLSSGSASSNLMGRLTAEWTQTGNQCASSYGPSVGALTARVILSYDVMGRPLMSQQCVKAMCTTQPFTQSQSYDLAGNMTSWQDGRGLMTFSQQFDSAGRPVSLTNSVSGNGLPSVLFSAQGYTPAGALQNWNVGNFLNFTRSYDNRFRITGEIVTH